jgi:hypothetical protein
MKRPRAVTAMLAAAGLAFGLIAFAAPAVSANAAYTELCDVEAPNQCWVNAGTNQYVTIASYPSGTAWNYAGDGRSWQGHPTYKIITGAGLCAQDDGTNSPGLVFVATSCTDSNGQRFYFPGGAIAGAIVSINTSIEEGHHWCLYRTNSQNIGNAPCPTGNLPAREDWVFESSS